MNGHDYPSTGCLHGDMVLPDGRTGHEYCQGETGAAGAKVPAECKFCRTPCRCSCHRQVRIEPESIYSTPVNIVVGPEFTAPEIMDLVAARWQGVREQVRRLHLRQASEAWAQETRRLWSGPDRLQRRIVRAYGLKPHQVGLAPRSVFTSEYRRRQRARVKRRRR